MSIKQNGGTEGSNPKLFFVARDAEEMKQFVWYCTLRDPYVKKLVHHEVFNDGKCLSVEVTEEGREKYGEHADAALYFDMQRMLCRFTGRPDNIYGFSLNLFTD